MLVYQMDTYMLFTSLGRSVLGNTVPSVLEPPEAGIQDLGHRPRLVNNIYLLKKKKVYC